MVRSIILVQLPDRSGVKKKTPFITDYFVVVEFKLRSSITRNLNIVEFLKMNKDQKYFETI
jgi:hypothetical protein